MAAESGESRDEASVAGMGVLDVVVLIADRDPFFDPSLSDAQLYEFRCTGASSPARHWQR